MASKKTKKARKLDIRKWIQEEVTSARWMGKRLTKGRSTVGDRQWVAVCGDVRVLVKSCPTMCTPGGGYEKVWIVDTMICGVKLNYWTGQKLQVGLNKSEDWLLRLSDELEKNASGQSVVRRIRRKLARARRKAAKDGPPDRQARAYHAPYNIPVHDT